MVNRGIVDIDYDGFSAELEDRICHLGGLDHDASLFLADFYHIDTFKPLLGNQHSLFGYLCTHILFPFETATIVTIVAQYREYGSHYA